MRVCCNLLYIICFPLFWISKQDIKTLIMDVEAYYIHLTSTELKVK
jgi:hypothetical protein